MEVIGTRWRFAALFSLLGLSFLLAPSASFAAVTIGEDTSTPGTASFMSCSGFSHHSCTFSQTVHPSRSYAAPIDGVIVRWRIRGDSKATQFALRAIRINGDGTYTGMGATEPRAVAPGIENVFTAQLPIGQGELIGLNVPGGSGNPQVERRPVPGATFSTWFYTPLQDGETRAPEGSGTNALVFNADLEPDCDRDGLGDETQDSSVASCHPRTLTLDASKSKVKRGKRVTLSGRVVETRQDGACVAGQPVELQRKRSSQATFATIEQLQTDSTGGFSAKEKVKKTSQYRAHLGESSTCGAGTSNTERVKVKKP